MSPGHGGCPRWNLSELGLSQGQLLGLPRCSLLGKAWMGVEEGMEWGVLAPTRICKTCSSVFPETMAPGTCL